MKVIVAGPRDFNNHAVVFAILEYYLSNVPDLEIVVGKARGVDTIAEQWARLKGIPVHEFPADWNKYGNSAGPIRNRQMGDFADYLIAFDWGSKGTTDMINYMDSLKKPYKVVDISKISI